MNNTNPVSDDKVELPTNFDTVAPFHRGNGEAHLRGIIQKLRESTDANKIDSKVSLELSDRAHLIQDTLTHLANANHQGKNTFFALLKTVMLTSLAAATILSGLFSFALPLTVLLAVATAGLSLLFYAQAGENLTFLEHRILNGNTDPLFFPNPNTLKGKLLTATLVLPILGGFVLPLVEACTRKSRTEKVLKQQREELETQIPSYCEFYKTEGEKLVTFLKEKIEKQEKAENRNPLYQKMLDCVYAQTDLLRKMDTTVPDFNPKSTT